MASAGSRNEYRYYAGGKAHAIRFGSLRPARAGRRSKRGSARKGKSPRPLTQAGPDVASTLHSQVKRLSGDFPRFHDLSESRALSAVVDSHTMVVPTETMVVEVESDRELDWLNDKFGMVAIQGGLSGKYLLRSPEGGDAGVRAVFEASRAVYRRGHVHAAHPNFLRVVRRPATSSGQTELFWNLDNNGAQGVPGADVHAEAAWTITEGSEDIRVAVLDEGVDSRHPHLRAAIVDEADFVDGNSHARPDGDDAHGTACAGIIGSRHSKYRGLAPGVSLIGVRIAKSDSQGYWIFDDFDTADAIDWAWDEADADVLSNSWGGGPPTDVITRAFERARTKGRNGKGAVIVVAAGNDQGLVDYPGNLPNVLTVGASNQWDKRKTKTSQDGEYWWGSNYGPGLDIMAPGVKIPTTDIRGARGYSSTLFTPNFNGTSSACPHVAAAAALILSVEPRLTEGEVRDLLTQSADRLARTPGWDRYTGHGRLNSYDALWRARRSK